MEFIEKANELDLSQMGDDGELDAGLEQMSISAGIDAKNADTPQSPAFDLASMDVDDEGTPAYTKTPSVEPPPPLLPDARADAHEPLTPPEATRLPEQATTEVVPRRPVGVIARWQLSGKMPNSVRVAIAVVVMSVCVLIWAYSHVEAGGPATVTAEQPPVPQQGPPVDDQAVVKAAPQPELRPQASAGDRSPSSASVSKSSTLEAPPTPLAQPSAKARPSSVAKMQQSSPSKLAKEIPAASPSAPSTPPAAGETPWRTPD